MWNNFKKQVVFYSFFLVFPIHVFAQTEAVYFTYPNNAQAINPAYAGSWGVAGVNLLVRKQSLTLQNGGNSQYLSYQTPLANNKAAFGFQAYNSNFVYNTNGGLGFIFSGVYRYHLSENDNIALGINAGLSQVSEGLVGSQTYKPNYGLGLYYCNPTQYAGIALPNMAQNTVSFGTAGNYQFPRQSFTTLGKVISPSENLDLKMGLVMMHELNNKKTKFDINAGLWYKKFIGLSLWYNTTGSEFNNKKATVISAECQASTKFRFGLSYDPSARNVNSQFNPQTGGRSYLAMYNILIKYDFDNLTGKINNFRFF